MLFQNTHTGANTYKLRRDVAEVIDIFAVVLPADRGQTRVKSLFFFFLLKKKKNFIDRPTITMKS